MPERILPTPDAFATCPTDGKVLDYYAGTFEAVYVLLHPFIRAVSIDKREFNPKTYPGRSRIVKDCAPVSWEEVAVKTGLPSMAAVDIGLRTIIRGLRPEFSNEEYANKILSLIDSDGIIFRLRDSFRICSTTTFFRPFRI